MAPVAPEELSVSVVLIGTSVWIDHFKKRESGLIALRAVRVCPIKWSWASWPVEI
jgi:hypothetical protein